MNSRSSFRYRLACLLVLLSIAAWPLCAQTTVTFTNNQTNSTAYDTTGNNLTLHFATFGTATQSGIISGTGSVTKTGGTDLIISGNNTYSGGTTISEGNLRMGHASALGTGNVFIGTNRILFSAGFAIDLTKVSGSGQLNGSGTFTFDSSSSASLGASLSGSGSLVKAGTGTLTLTNSSGRTGTTTINGGTLVLANEYALNESVLIVPHSGGISFGTLTTVHLGGLSGSNPLSLTNDSGAAIALHLGRSSVSSSYSGILSGGGSLTKVDEGTLTLSGNNSYSGGTALKGGTIDFTSLANFGTGTITADSDRVTLRWAAGNTSDFGNRLIFDSNSQGIILDTNGNNVTLSTQFGPISSGNRHGKTGSGVLTLTATSSFNDEFRVSGGSLELSNPEALKFANVSLYGGSLTFSTNTAATIGSLGGGSSLALANASGAAVTLTLGGAGLAENPNYGGAITGSGSLILSGGNQSFEGASTFSGGVTVKSGATLSANNEDGSATGSGTVTVQSGGILAGGTDFDSGTARGFLGGPVIIETGGRIAPGDSSGGPGQLTFSGGLTLSTGSILDFKFGGPYGDDLIKVTGGTFAGPSSGTVTINFSEDGGLSLGSYPLINYATATGTSNLSASSFSLGSTVAGYSYGLSLAGETLQLNVSAIPEPSTYAAIFGAAALGLAVYRRRRARSA